MCSKIYPIYEIYASRYLATHAHTKPEEHLRSEGHPQPCHPQLPCHPSLPCHPERSEGSKTVSTQPLYLNPIAFPAPCRCPNSLSQVASITPPQDPWSHLYLNGVSQPGKKVLATILLACPLV